MVTFHEKQLFMGKRHENKFLFAFEVNSGKKKDFRFYI